MSSNVLCLTGTSPLVSIPIQLRYRVSFFAMYVFPRAGKPTITITHGAMATLAMSGHNAVNIQKEQLLTFTFKDLSHSFRSN